MAVGIRHCKGISDHAAAPGEANPAERAGCNDLEDDVVGLACGDVCGLRYAVDDVAGECGCGLCLGEGKTAIWIHVAYRARC